MNDATWIWDAVLSRMDWANQEGLDFIGVQNLNDLQKIRFNAGLPWVLQLNDLSHQDLPSKGSMEKISFPNGVILNCWIKNHQVDDGHKGLWIILKEDHLAKPVPAVDKQPIGDKDVVDTEKVISTIKPEQEQDISQPDEVLQPSLALKPNVVRKEDSREECSQPLNHKMGIDQDSSAANSQLGPETKPPLKAVALEAEQGRKQSTPSGDQAEEGESNKILALIARQINARTGGAYKKEKLAPVEAVQKKKAAKNHMLDPEPSVDDSGADVPPVKQSDQAVSILAQNEDKIKAVSSESGKAELAGKAVPKPKEVEAVEQGDVSDKRKEDRRKGDKIEEGKAEKAKMKGPVKEEAAEKGAAEKKVGKAEDKAEGAKGWQSTKITLPGMAELMKQMRASESGPVNDNKRNIDKRPSDKSSSDKGADESASNTSDNDDLYQSMAELKPYDSVVKRISAEEHAPERAHSATNSEGIHETKIISDKNDVDIKEDSVAVAREGAEKQKVAIEDRAQQMKDDSRVVARIDKRAEIKADIKPIAQEQDKGRPDLDQEISLDQDKGNDQAEVVTDEVAASESPEADTIDTETIRVAPKQGGAASQDLNATGGQTVSTIQDFPVASAIASGQGKFIAASDLFALAMGFRDEQDLLQHGQFEKMLPEIFARLIKSDSEARNIQFFDKSEGFTKSGRKMKLSLSAKSTQTEQGKSHYMILYPTGIGADDTGLELAQNLEAIKQAATDGRAGAADQVVKRAERSVEQVQGASSNGDSDDIKDEYERTLPFLAKVSHEIRTPLNSIIGFSEIMKEEQFGPLKNERYLGYMNDIYVSANHALSLVNDMLDISRIQAGSLELDKEVMNVNEQVQSAIKSMAPQFAQKDIHVWQGLSEKKLTILCDKRSFRQIVLNLVSNAIKYTPQGGQITITTALEKGSEVVFRVRDTGIGMADVDIKQAMKPFQRLDTILRHETNGSGLGLPLTKALIETNNGWFKIESAVDKGTVASVMFPKAKNKV